MSDGPLELVQGLGQFSLAHQDLAEAETRLVVRRVCAQNLPQDHGSGVQLPPVDDLQRRLKPSPGVPAFPRGRRILRDACATADRRG